MTSKGIEKLYHLKELAVEHLKAGRYQQSVTYFKDILDKFKTAIEDLTDADHMEKAIR